MKTYEKINFSKILNNKDTITVVMNSSLDISVHVIQKIAHWKDYFKSIYFAFPENHCLLFKMLIDESNIEIISYKKLKNIVSNSICVSLISLKKLSKYNTFFENSAHINIYGGGNFQFVKQGDDVDSFIIQVERFLGIPVTDSKLALTISSAEKRRLKALLNLYGNDSVLIHIKSNFYSFYSKQRFKFLWENLNCAVYVTGKWSFKIDSEHIRKLSGISLDELACLASMNDLTISDDLGFIKFLKYMNINALFLGNLPENESLQSSSFSDMEKVVKKMLRNSSRKCVI